MCGRGSCGRNGLPAPAELPCTFLIVSLGALIDHPTPSCGLSGITISRSGLASSLASACAWRSAGVALGPSRAGFGGALGIELLAMLIARLTGYSERAGSESAMVRVGLMVRRS